MSDGFTRDELKSHGIETVDELVWDDDTYLKPGVDYHDGITYFTIPVKRHVEKTTGRGKAAETKIIKILDLAVVTSDRRAFPYDAEVIAKLGFSYPDTVTGGKQRRWSGSAITEFLKHQDTPPDPATLFDGIRQVYSDYVEFERGADDPMYDVMPLFVMGTYLFRLYRSLGYIHFNGTAASGKSQNLRILDALAFNTYWASSMSAAALYRQLAGMPGTVCIDEAEGWEGERGEELRRILNAGYLDGSTVGRVEKGPTDRFIVQQFESFGPKVLASINPLDAVIGSRCLIVRMRPALRKIGEFDKDDPRWQRFRDRLYAFAMYHTAPMEKIVDRWNATTRFDRAPKLQQRHWQITQLYITLADYLDSFDAGTRCDRLIAYFNEYFEAQQRAADATDRIRILLQCLPRVIALRIAEDGGFYTLKAIHEEVVSRLDTDAAEYFKTRTVAKHLDVLGFKNKRSKKGGTQVFLDPDQVRSEFRQRRVEPFEEDRDWLDGTDYTPPTTPDDPDDSIWADIADEETAA